MTGLELLEVFEQNEAYSGVPVVTISANPCTSVRIGGRALHKPFTADQLHNLLHAHACAFGAPAEGRSVLSRRDHDLR